jgi:hypothetical protein
VWLVCDAVLVSMEREKSDEEAKKKQKKRICGQRDSYSIFKPRHRSKLTKFLCE